MRPSAPWPLVDDREAADAHLAAGLGIGQHAVQRIGQRGHITGGEDATVLAIRHQILGRPDLVADDDGAACVHYLVDHETPGFEHRGKHEHVA